MLTCNRPIEIPSLCLLGKNMALHLVLEIQLFYFVFAQEHCCCLLLGHSFVFHYITDKSLHIELVEYFFLKLILQGSTERT